jgi:hypothetical protein
MQLIRAVPCFCPFIMNKGREECQMSNVKLKMPNEGLQPFINRGLARMPVGLLAGVSISLLNQSQPIRLTQQTQQPYKLKELNELNEPN